MTDKDLAHDLSLHLLPQIQTLIDAARKRAAVAVNAELTLLYWRIGKLLNERILQGERATYGQQVMQRLALDLTAKYGKGWSKQQLLHCLKVAQVFPDEEIVYALCIQLSWTHLRKLIFIEDPLKREFYTEMCKAETWSTRQLSDRIQSMLFERTAISKQPTLTIQADLEQLRTEGTVSPDLAFRDPYILDFLGLADTYSEHDLLFYHRRLRRLVAIDLKIGEFEAAYKGQMELYLRYLEKHEVRNGELQPIGLILCSGKNQEHVELLQLDSTNIRVAEYLTELPSRELLQQKLHESMERARLKFAERMLSDGDIL
jgi:predicted nuclease of restriction endonuclease-like (RecB) superfamily